MYYVYVLKSRKDNKFYVGYTNNLERRVKQHRSARKGYYTSGKGPWDLVYYEVFEDKATAIRREKFYKSGKGREVLKKKIETESVAQFG